MTHHLYPFSYERSYFFGPLHDHNRLCHGSKTFFRKPDKDKRFYLVFVVKNTSFAAISCRKLSGGGSHSVQTALFDIASALIEYCTLHSEHHRTSLTCLVPAAATDLWSSHSGATFHDKKH